MTATDGHETELLQSRTLVPYPPVRRHYQIQSALIEPIHEGCSFSVRTLKPPNVRVTLYVASNLNSLFRSPNTGTPLNLKGHNFSWPAAFSVWSQVRGFDLTFLLLTLTSCPPALENTGPHNEIPRLDLFGLLLIEAIQPNPDLRQQGIASGWVSCTVGVSKCCLFDRDKQNKLHVLPSAQSIRRTTCKKKPTGKSSSFKSVSGDHLIRRFTLPADGY